MEGIEQLREGITALLGVEMAELNNDELEELLVGLHREQARVVAAVSGFMSVFDRRRAFVEDGSKSAGAWLARRCNTSGLAMARQVRLARRLRGMPLTADALAGGEIDENHAGVLAKVAASPRPAVADAFPAAEGDLVGFARDLSFDDFV